MRLSRFVLGVILAACLFGGRAAEAQPAQPDAQETPETFSGEQRWEIEAHGGLSLDRDPSGGNSSIPSTSSTVQGLLSLSTFLFGSGSSSFNQIHPGGPISPLDSALAGQAITRGQSFSAGARVFRAITERFGVEFSGELVDGQRTFTSTTLKTLEASRSSFIQALGSTLPGAAVNAVTTITDKQNASRALATGAAVFNLKTTGRTIPYLVAGGGIMFNNGTFPSGSVTGTYQVGSPSALYGTDSVRLTYSEDDHEIVYLGGGGIKQQLSTHFGLRADARVHIYQTSMVNIVDVSPSQQLSTVGAPPPIITVGSLQFSALGPLNGPPYAGAASYSATGVQAQVSITAGVFFRF